jgi:AAA ATPase domain
MMSTPVPSPYRPGFATQPPLLAGRQHLLQLVETSVRTSGNRRQSFQVLYGPRGVGKTVLLDRYAAIAAERNWATVRHEARSPGDPIGAIVEQLHGCAGLTKKLSRELVELRERWGEESQTLNLGIYRRESKRQRRDAIPVARQFAGAVIAVAEHCTEHQRGLMILVDEVQEVHPDELSVFGPIMQDLSRRPALTAMIVFGGLPDTPGLVTDAVTYGERMAFHAIDNLDVDSTFQALAGPADAAGRPFDGDALAALVDATAGYPYFVQLFGDYAWQTSDTHKRITLDDALTAVDLARHDSERGLYVARWKKLPAGEQTYLTAMARISTVDPVRTGDIADALGKPITALSAARNRLLDRGVIVAPSVGHVAASIPGFLTYVLAVSDPSRPPGR